MEELIDLQEKKPNHSLKKPNGVLNYFKVEKDLILKKDYLFKYFIWVIKVNLSMHNNFNPGWILHPKLMKITND